MLSGRGTKRLGTRRHTKRTPLNSLSRFYSNLTLTTFESTGKTSLPSRNLELPSRSLELLRLHNLAIAAATAWTINAPITVDALFSLLPTDAVLVNASFVEMNLQSNLTALHGSQLSDFDLFVELGIQAALEGT